jgi:hypothetical protein
MMFRRDNCLPEMAAIKAAIGGAQGKALRYRVGRFLATTGFRIIE